MTEARSSSWIFLVICSVLRMTSSVLGSVGSDSISTSSSSGMELPSPSQPLLLSLPLLLKLQGEDDAVEGRCLVEGWLMQQGREGAAYGGQRKGRQKREVVMVKGSRWMYCVPRGVDGTRVAQPSLQPTDWASTPEIDHTGQEKSSADRCGPPSGWHPDTPVFIGY
ncbi:hypothetical protein INR49_006211 [Caranx melampygus]|nr:hypothetical protein INR49_006211 [Caranx melampygus]